MFKPLDGVRVIDLTQVLAGPYATYQLGLMGAEVIKIEKPGEGDWTRVGGSISALSEQNMGLGYLTQNGNKKSIALNLKCEAGVNVIRQLVKTADVFVENLRPGATASLGLGFDEIKQLNDKIVYCSISAYGQDGPIGHRPAYDHVVQGMCGIMAQTGDVDGGPTKVGAPYIDYATGQNAALAIVSALHEVRRTNRAIHLDVAMLDSAMMLMASLMTNCLTSGWKPQQTGNAAWSQSPSSGAFETTDGLLMLAANTAVQFGRLCRALGRSDILDDPRWNTPERRKENAAALGEELAAVFATRPAAEWEAVMDEADVPAARVRRMDEVLVEGQLQARGIMSEIMLPDYDKPVHVPSLGFKTNGDVTEPDTPPPQLGRDTESVLRSVGMDDAQITQLRRDGVV
ncbi:MAG: CaiB/BaiF CoA transferase family protein [Hyphomicrobiaceae bacterium]